MNNDNLKKALTYEEQIQRLILRNLKIENHQRAASILRFTNYYRLSAYSLGLRDENDIFHENVNLEQIYNIYSFDEELRHLLFEIIEPIELRLRAELAYQLSVKCGNIAHLDPNIKKDRRKHLSFLSRYYQSVDQSMTSECVKHNVVKYGELPIWAAVEVLTLGTLSMFYGNLRPEYQRPIAKSFYCDVDRFGGWLESLCEIRNICAHAGRIYNKLLSKKPKLYREQRSIINSQNIPQNKLFLRLLIIRHMYNGKGKWTIFYNKFCKLMEQFINDINLSHFGFPDKWELYLKPKE